MASSKSTDHNHDKHSAAGAAGWKEQHHKHTQAAKEAFEKFSEHLKASKPDHAAVIHSHKKNLEALKDTHKMTAELMKSIASLQSQFVKQTFEEMNAIMRGLMTQNPGKPFDLEAHSEAIKNSIQRTMDHAKNVGNVISSSGKGIHARMHESFEESKEEIKAHAAKKKSTEKKH